MLNIIPWATLEPVDVARGAFQLKWEKNCQQYLIFHMLSKNVCIYRSLIKERPWVELLTSLAKKREGALLSVSTFILTTKECPCHIYSDFMPSKKIFGQNNLQRNHQQLQSQFLTAPCHHEHGVARSAHCLFMQSCCVVTFGEVLHKVSCFRYV